ncbi:MAG: hypothetical protein D6681_18765 [Calditrichaeota bacterium]|nr:MAG: hypothetical protein D6681_18765 [Calditrichota bacterium]
MENVNSNGKFKENIILLVIGFVLTSILGGGIGTYFQHRAWENQWKVLRIERELQHKTKVFERISSLLDERLFRARQLLWSLNGKFKDKDVEQRLQMYRESVRNWNEQLNSNSALIEIYFGKDFRDKFEREIGKEFVDNGMVIEKLYNQYRRTKKRVNTTQAEQKLNDLYKKIYRFDLELLESIKNLSENPV